MAARRPISKYSVAEALTDEEIAALKREAKETSAYFRKAFAHLRPKGKPGDR